MGEIEASRRISVGVFSMMHSKIKDMYIISHTRDSPAIGITLHMNSWTLLVRECLKLGNSCEAY